MQLLCFQAFDTFLVPKCKEISPKINWRRFKVYWMIFTFIFTSNKWIGKLWVWWSENGWGSKISKSNIWQFFVFILSADEVFPYTNFECCVKTCKTHSTNLLRWISVEIPLHLGTRNESIAWKTPEVRLLPWRSFKFFLHFNLIIIVELYISLNMVTPLARNLVWF